MSEQDNDNSSCYIWVLTEWYVHEGENILGVFNCQEELIDKIESEARSRSSTVPPNGYTGYLWEVGGELVSEHEYSQHGTKIE